MDIQLNYDNGVDNTSIILDGIEYFPEISNSNCNCNRSIYLFDNYVIKVDSLDFHQCNREVFLYFNVIEEEDRVWFAEVLDYGENYIICKRIQNTGKTDEDGFSILEPIISRYDLSNDVLPGKNWCWNGDSPIIFDWALSDLSQDLDD
jgi:hypothetical protein